MGRDVMRVVMSYDVVLRGVVWRCVVVWSEEIRKDRYNKNTITHTYPLQCTRCSSRSRSGTALRSLRAAADSSEKSVRRSS